MSPGYGGVLNISNTACFIHRVFFVHQHRLRRGLQQRLGPRHDQNQEVHKCHHSHILFILALDELVKTHDVHGSGVKCGSGLVVRILDYADDTALLEEELEVMTKKLTILVDAAKAEADMVVSMKKTVSQHVGAAQILKSGD